MTAAERRVELVFEVPWSHPAWVLEDEQVPISAAQDDASTVIASTWREWARREGRAVRVRRDLAVRWDEQHPRVGVDPDVCLLEPPPATVDAELTSLRTWEPGNHPPRVSVEVVSEGNAAKDYDLGPRKHAASGVGELWVFDPQRFGPDVDGGPWRLQVWARGRRGEFRRVYAGDGPAWSEYFRAWLVVSPDGMSLRLADDEAATRVWPTEAEAAEAARAESERERAEKERALARLAEYEALLAARAGAPTGGA